MSGHIARLQALFHANDQTLRNLAPEIVDIASINGSIWEAKSCGNNLIVTRVSTETNYVGKRKILVTYLTRKGEKCALQRGTRIRRC